MIIDRLCDAEKYFKVNPGFEAAFGFLRQAVLREPEEGEYEIAGKEVYAVVSSAKGRGIRGAKLEAHKEYTDIQFCISGSDVIGWGPASGCVSPEGEHDKKKDIRFFFDEPESWFLLKDEIFCVLDPEDAHAPLAGDGDCKKIVVKVRALR